eukprot:GHVU01102033.1.p1 GENE.GHVU01102033.1~~GHVU01102033.1.p1  ORF type:complete len:170 (-),score=14.77 GHVU01102033.1:235-744(-)
MENIDLLLCVECSKGLESQKVAKRTLSFLQVFAAFDTSNPLPLAYVVTSYFVQTIATAGADIGGPAADQYGIWGMVRCARTEMEIKRGTRVRLGCVYLDEQVDVEAAVHSLILKSEQTNYEPEIFVRSSGDSSKSASSSLATPVAIAGSGATSPRHQANLRYLVPRLSP